jgi:hypothetical protein
MLRRKVFGSGGPAEDGAPRRGSVVIKGGTTEAWLTVGEGIW